MPWSTLEVRWFFSGAVEVTGREVAAWFAAGARARRGQSVPWDPAPPGWRQDRYLLIPDHDDMGIKWRESRLEIKGREADLGPRAFAPGIEGRCERWNKWSYAGAGVAARFRKLFQGEGAAAGVLVVEKRRLQRLLRVGDRGEIAEVTGDEPRVRGVNVELARVRLPAWGEEHWSLAFEAFPGDDAMAEPFAQAVAQVLEGCPALPLPADPSMAYPRWLLRIDNGTSTPA